ncbi:MAG: hypothetical protein QOJ10_1344 [Chloroflexota bacterium]|nr:hypothetical protein [Chloroflexota bacterium]
MTRKAAWVALSAVVGVAVAILVYAAVLVPFIRFASAVPHVYTASELQALPEAHLVYPGSILVHEDIEDEVPQSLEPAREAYVQRLLTFPGSPKDVLPWFSARLEPNGWLRQPTTKATPAYLWSKGHYTFLLAVCGDGGDGYLSQRPCTNQFFVSIYAI